MVVRMRAHGVRVHASQMEWQRYWSAAWNRSRDEAIRYRAQVIEATDHARTLGVHLRRLVLAHQEEKERLVERAREREEGLLARILKLQEELLACGRHELAKDGVEGPLGDLQRGRGTEEQELEPGAGIMEEMLQAQHEEELEGRDFRLEMWKVDEVWRPGSGGGDEAEELRQEPALTTRPLVEELSMDLRQPTPPDQPEPTPVASDGAC